MHSRLDVIMVISIVLWGYDTNAIIILMYIRSGNRVCHGFFVFLYDISQLFGNVVDRLTHVDLQINFHRAKTLGALGQYTAVSNLSILINPRVLL